MSTYVRTLTMGAGGSLDSSPLLPSVYKYLSTLGLFTLSSYHNNNHYISRSKVNAIYYVYLGE